MNELIERIFKDFTVDGVAVPVKFLQYHGNLTTYVTYQQVGIQETLYADDSLQVYVEHYDFDIYSKGNYLPVLERVKDALISNGFNWQPTEGSADMYETNTGYYHKTLCFAIERSESNGTNRT